MEALHPLQTIFATFEGEAAWCGRLRAMIEAADLAEAEATLEAELAGIESNLAQLCRQARRESVVVTGWPELLDAIAVHEGEPIAGVAIAIANEADLAFEKGRLITPYMMLGIYTDEAFAWSHATHEELLAQAKAESPAWAGHDEDIEAYLEVEGLEALNTALIHHKQRHFIREGNPDHAPLRYVEYVLGCWWRALRFHQAVATELALHGLPGGAPVVSGLVDMAPEVVSVHIPAGRESLTVGAEDLMVVEEFAGNDNAPYGAYEYGDEEDEDEDDGERPDEHEDALLLETLTAELFSPNFVPRRPIEEVREVSGADLRRRLVVAAASEPEPAPPEVKRGFWARLFGRA